MYNMINTILIIYKLYYLSSVRLYNRPKSYMNEIKAHALNEIKAHAMNSEVAHFEWLSGFQ